MNVAQWLKKSIKYLLGKSFYLRAIKFCYPQTCLHCQNETGDDAALVCNTCAELLELIDPKERCEICFGQKTDGEMICLECRRKRPKQKKVISCFEWEGPARSLLLQFTQGGRPWLAKGLASFLLLAKERANLPQPDFLIALPPPFFHFFEQSYDPNLLLAKELGLILSVPVLQLFERCEEEYLHSLLVRNESGEVSYRALKMKGKQNTQLIENKVLFVIGDLYDKGTMIDAMVTKLKYYHPKLVYVLTVCR